MTKPHFWNPEKNAWLKRHRGFGFEDVVEAVESGGLLDDMKHPSAAYRNQRLDIVAIGGDAVVVPYVEEADHIFLKTAFPDRRANRKYLNR